MANLGKIVYLTNAQFQTLVTDGSITVGGVTVTYSANDMYVTPSGEVVDVQVNGSSIVASGVANIPAAAISTLGVVQLDSGKGITVDVNTPGKLAIVAGSDYEIKNGNQSYRPIVPTNQHKSVFYGLAKASGNSDQASSSNAVGVYTDDAKLKIQQMFGLWTPKCYVKYTQEEDANATDTISFDQANVPIEIFEELVIVIYQSDANSGQTIASNDWSYINVRDSVNSAYLTGNNVGYFKASKPSIIKFKRYPGCIIGEATSGGAFCGTYAWVRSSDYFDNVTFIQMACSNGTVKAGTTIEAYIHRFI